MLPFARSPDTIFESMLKTHFTFLQKEKKMVPHPPQMTKFGALKMIKVDQTPVVTTGFG